MWNEFSRLMTALLSRLDLRREDGQGLVEYSLILALVAIAAITILGVLGGDIVSELGKVTNAL
jgi:pilus assembly protein Flp/PilA